MKKIISILLGILQFLNIIAQSDKLCFNEIMQSNVDCYFIDYDFPDSWIEIYNPTGEIVNLQNYRIGDSKDFISAYKITEKTEIFPNGYLVISCDKTGKGLHTNFRLESTDQGTIYLFSPSGNQICTLSYPAMLASNVAYGRESDGNNNWGWELCPTPGESNTGGLSNYLLPNPIFNISSQIIKKQTHVTISMPEGNYPSDTKIYVTTDGSEPTKNSESGKLMDFDISQSMVIRAKLMSNTAISPRSITNSYIMNSSENKLPIISISTDKQYLFSDQIGIISSSETNGIPNYKYEWRRPINVEYLGFPNDPTMFNQISEIAIGGAASREYEQKSLKLYSNKRFETKRFRGVLWSHKQHVNKVKSFMLRNGGNNAHRSRINDALIQRIFGWHIPNIDYLEYNPVVVFINGEYKGYYGLRERSNEDFVSANYNGLEDIEMADAEFYMNSTKRNTSPAFSKLYSAYTNTSTSYNSLASLIDIENFLNTVITEVFATNTDYPHNNIAMWRPMTQDGKWRWILKDLDRFSIQVVPITFNMFDYLFNPNYKHDNPALSNSVKIYQKMMSFPEFKEKFIDTFSVYLGDFLKPSITVRIVDEMRDEIIQEIDPTEKAWDMVPGRLNSFSRWVDSIRSNIQVRPKIIYHQMADYFSLGDVIPVSITQNGKPVTINDIKLTEGDFSGAYFSNYSLRLNSGLQNVGWQLKTYRVKNGVMVKNEEDIYFPSSMVSVKLKEYANCDSVSFITYAISESDIEKKLKELNIFTKDCKDWSNEKMIAIPEPDYAYANISEIIDLPTEKNDYRDAFLELYDNNGNYFKKKILIKLQGNSITKPNLSITFNGTNTIEEESTNIQIGEWVPEDEFYLKSFYKDGLRGTAEVAYQLYSKISNQQNRTPHAFPLSLYINGSFYGIMSWQTKKTCNNLNLDKKSSSNVWLDGTLNDKQLFEGNINWTKFEIRCPKDLYNMDGSDYNGDTPQEIMDETSASYSGKTKQKRCAEAKEHIISLSQYNTELTELVKKGVPNESIKNAIRERFDEEELINYMVFSLITNNYDGFSQNWQWITYDSKKWTIVPYDCDLTFGYNEEGSNLWPASQSSKKYDYRMSNADMNGPMKWIRTYFWNEVKLRYAHLRDQKIIDTDNILKLFQSWTDRIGNKNYTEEWNKWQNSPIKYGEEENLYRLKEWISTRIQLEDLYLEYTTQLANYELEITDSHWATICIPFNFDIPSNLQLYSIVGKELNDSTLILQEKSAGIANKPYLAHGEKGNYPLDGQIKIGSPSENGYLKEGLLIGTLDDIFAPENTYVLQNQNDRTAFYWVNQENSIKIPAHHAYLQLNTTMLQIDFLKLPSSTTDIQYLSIEHQKRRKQFYNYSGQRVSEDYPGLKIAK